MCISCLLFSTLTLFMPVTETAPSANGTLAAPQANVSGLISAQESRNAIASLLAELPHTEEMALLRTELQALKAQLAQTQSVEEADLLLETGLKTVSDRVLAGPHADSAIDVLSEMVLLDEKPNAMRSPLLKMLQSSNPGIKLPEKNNLSWGWLH